MSTTTVSAPKSDVVVNEDVFCTLAKDYRTSRKLVDALASSENPDNSIKVALQVIGRLKSMVANGDGYTPATRHGFGSDNASAIALTILGQRASTSTIRSKFAKIGA